MVCFFRFLLSPFLAHLSQRLSFSDQYLSVVRRCRFWRWLCRKLFHIFIFFSRTTGPISTKLNTKYPWVKGDFKFVQIKGPVLFQGKIIRKLQKYIDKIRWTNFNLILHKALYIKHPWVKGIQVCSNEEPFTSQKVKNGFLLLLISIMISICVY